MAAGVKIKSEPNLSNTSIPRKQSSHDMSGGPSAYQEYDERELAKMFGLSEFVEVPKSNLQPQSNSHSCANNGSAVKQEPSQSNFMENMNGNRSFSNLPLQIAQTPNNAISNTMQYNLDYGKHNIQNHFVPPNGPSVQLQQPSNLMENNLTSVSTTPAENKRLKKSPALAAQLDGDERKILTQYTFLCPLCSFKSAHRGNVRRHQVSAHPGLSREQLSQVGEKALYLCQHCSFASAHKGNVRRHMKSAHSIDFSHHLDGLT